MAKAGVHGPREDQADRHRRRQGRASWSPPIGGVLAGAAGRARDRPAGDAAQDGRPRRGAGEGRLPADRPAPVRGQARAGGGRRRLRARGGNPARRRERRRRSRSRTGSPSSGAAVPLNKQRHRRPPQERAHQARSCRPRCSRSERDAVSLKNGTAPSKIPNDFVIACLGGELPNEFLKSIGVSIRKHHGDKAMANPTPRAQEPAPAQRAARRASCSLSSASLVVAGLVAVGWKYYLLPREPSLQVARPRVPEAVGHVGPRRRRAGDDVHAAQLRLPAAQTPVVLQGKGIDRPLAAVSHLRRDHEPARDPVSHRVPVGQPARDHHLCLGAWSSSRPASSAATSTAGCASIPWMLRRRRGSASGSPRWPVRSRRSGGNTPTRVMRRCATSCRSSRTARRSRGH